MKKYLLLFLVCFTAFATESTPLNHPHKRVYVDIVGDLFHSGHVEFFKQARAFGDYLIVGILADDVVQGYKRTPILSLEERVKIVQACKYVDEVVVAPPLRLTEEMIQQYKIDVVVHGDDFNPALLDDQYGLSRRLGIFRSVPYTKGISTSDIIRRITKRYTEGEFQR